jgi:hypothetical protein
MLEMILKNWPAESQLVGYTILLIWLYFKLKTQMAITRKMVTDYQNENKSRWSKIEKTYDDLAAVVTEHKESESPHLNCPAHGEAIQQIEGRLNRIQNDISGVRSELTELNRTLLLIATNSANMAEKKRVAGDRL